MLLGIGDETGEADPVGDLKLLRECAKLRFPPTVPGHGKAESRQLARQRRGRAQRNLDPLVRYQPAEHDQVRLGVAWHRCVGDLRRSIVDHGNTVEPYAQCGELGPGGLGHCDVLAVPIGPRREP